MLKLTNDQATDLDGTDEFFWLKLDVYQIDSAWSEWTLLETIYSEMIVDEDQQVFAEGTSLHYGDQVSVQYTNCDSCYIFASAFESDPNTDYLYQGAWTFFSADASGL